jgi:hypothetical protein
MTAINETSPARSAGFNMFAWIAAILVILPRSIKPIEREQRNRKIIR